MPEGMYLLVQSFSQWVSNEWIDTFGSVQLLLTSHGEFVEFFSFKMRSTQSLTISGYMQTVGRIINTISSYMYIETPSASCMTRWACSLSPSMLNKVVDMHHIQILLQNTLGLLLYKYYDCNLYLLYLCIIIYSSLST